VQVDDLGPALGLNHAHQGQSLVTEIGSGLYKEKMRKDQHHHEQQKQEGTNPPKAREFVSI
jgi:hypothetical protein